MEEKDLIPMEQIRHMVNKENNSNLAHNEIQTEYDRAKQGLQTNEDFKKLTNEIVVRSAKAELSKDMLAILTEEQKNELTAYMLECEKGKLAYRKKQEKKVIIEEVKAEVSNKKIEALKKRYGYLYPKDEKGEPVGFVANKAVNKYKEFCNWWDGTTDGFKRIVKGSLKVVFWTGVATLVCVLGYRGLKWITDNTKNLPNL
jgi:hypothetical protein